MDNTEQPSPGLQATNALIWAVTISLALLAGAAEIKACRQASLASVASGLIARVFNPAASLCVNSEKSQ